VLHQKFEVLGSVGYCLARGSYFDSMVLGAAVGSGRNGLEKVSLGIAARESSLDLFI